MFIRKTSFGLWVVAAFLLGFLASQTYHQLSEFFKPAKKPIAAPVQEVREKEPPPNPNIFFQSLNVNELLQFDQLYEQRQNELRDIMASGTQEEALLVPKGLFAQLVLIQTKIDFLNHLTTFTEGQASVKQSFVVAYRLLQEAYDQETEFLKNYPEQGQNIAFITRHIFEISSKDQRSGMEFLNCLTLYRKILAEAIRGEQTAEENQSWVRDLVTLNSLIEKYKIRLNVPKEPF